MDNSGWMPIETMPIGTGDWLLGWLPGHIPFVFARLRTPEMPDAVLGTFTKHGWTEIKPTHWQFLPAPPEAQP